MASLLTTAPLHNLANYYSDVILVLLTYLLIILIFYVSKNKKNY